MHGEGEQRILKRHDTETPQSGERKRLRRGLPESSILAGY